MWTLLVVLVAILIFAVVISVLTAMINTVLVALGFSVISWWVVVLIIAIIRIVKWLLD